MNSQSKINFQFAKVTTKKKGFSVKSPKQKPVAKCLLYNYT